MTARSRSLARSIAIPGIAGLTALTAPAHAEGYLQPFIEGRNNLHRNINGEDLDAFATTLRESGRIVIDIEMENIVECTAHALRCLRFHLVSAPNPDNRGWDIVGGVEKSAYDSYWKRNRDRGFRPTDIEAADKHVVNYGGRGGVTKVYYAGLWVENREQLVWASFSEIERDRFDREYRERVRDGNMVLIAFEGTGYGSRKVAAIFVRPRADRRTSRWQPRATEYETDAPRIFSSGGGWPLYFRIAGPDPKFDIGLMQDGVREARVFTALNDQQLEGRLGDARRDGFQLVDIEQNRGKWIAVFLRGAAE